MKSLLVDALRQAQEGEASGTLSDSGSFDATRDDFGVDQSPDGNLELLETGEPAVTDPASNDAVEFMPEERAATASESRISNTAVPTAVEEAPRLAKYSPVLCLCLALVAAGFWAVYLKIDVRNSATALGAVFSESRQSQSSEQAGQDSSDVRFPFLSAPEPSTADEVSE